MSNIRYILFAVACYFAFLIFTLPANLAYVYWKDLLGAQVPLVLEGINGSIWSGSAAQAHISNQELQKLKWQFHPLQLFLGKVEVGVDFSMNDGYAKANVGQSVFGNPYLDTVEAWLPMAEVFPIFNLQSLKPGGHWR